MVSRKPDAVCFHCGTVLDKCDLDYITYMNMTEEERIAFKENYKNRVKSYQEKMDTILLNKQTDKE
jgi:hypothetical protein